MHTAERLASSISLTHVNAVEIEGGSDPAPAAPVAPVPQTDQTLGLPG